MKIPNKIAKKIKKTKKTPYQHYLLAKWDEIGGEREKKILVTTSVHTRPGQENYEKNRKKNQKIKKPISGIILGQNGIRLAEKERKKFYSRILFLPNPS